MRRFLQLYLSLDETNSTNQKIEYLKDYFRGASSSDAAWATYFLSGRRFKRLVSAKLLRKITREVLSWPRWLFNEVMSAVGDTAEAISLSIDTGLLLDSSSSLEEQSLTEWVADIQQLGKMKEEDQVQIITQWWTQLDREGIFLLNKLITGGFRVGVSKLTTANAIADLYDIDRTTILHRMMGKWKPTPQFFNNLISEDDTDIKKSRPYPFFLASPLESEITELGNCDDWLIEWKWDGIRSQLVKREGEVFLWSRGEEIINISFPEIVSHAHHFPDGTVIDGEIIAYFDGEPLSFTLLQRRIGREDVTAEILDEAPVIIMAYDIMEFEGKDIRELDLRSRRSILEELLDEDQQKIPQFLLSPELRVRTWEEAQAYHRQSRDYHAEGFILKRRSSTYQTGRKRGDWWKWKIDPLSVDAVMIYAQSGSGRRASLFTDYTFAVWDGDELVPIGKAYSGLTDEEIRELDNWIRSNTDQKFGPVRAVEPVQVFELGFDGIMTNKRSKSGLSLRFPRILRWRKDKLARDADTLENVQKLLKYEGKTEIKRYSALDEFF